MSKEQNVLKSQFHGTNWNGYPTVILPIDELWASVPQADVHMEKPFYSRLVEDIGRNGLRFPLLIVHATRKEMVDQKNRWKGQLCELPFDPATADLSVRQYVIWGGSNRVRVAQELGYSHIDCVIIESFALAHKMQTLHREPYKETYYTKPDAKNKPADTAAQMLAEARWIEAVPDLLAQTRQPAAGPREWTQYGTCLEALGRHALAAEAFMKAQGKAPQNSSIYAHIFRNLYLAGELDTLRDFASFCNQMSPEILKAFTRDEFFAPVFSQEAFKASLQQPPAPQDNRNAPDVCPNAPSSDDNIKAYEELLKDESTLPLLREETEKDPESAVAWFNYGLCLKVQEQYNEAAEAFLKVQALTPQNEAIYPAIFRCLHRAGNLELLFDFANYCRQLSPDMLQILAQDETLKEVFEHPEFKALIQPTEAPVEPITTSVEPTEADKLQAYEELMRDEATLPMLKEVTEKDPTSEVGWFNYGLCLKVLERYDEAAEAFLKVQELNPGNDSLYPLIFRCLHRAGDLELLFNFAAYCKEISTEIITSIAQHEQFYTLFERPEFKNLLESDDPDPHPPTRGPETQPPQESIADAPLPNARSHDGCLTSYETLLKNEAALTLLREHTEKHPQDEMGWYNYGLCLKVMEHYELAAEAFLRAQELNSRIDAVYPAIFLCLKLAGNSELLLNFARYCKELSPDIIPAIAQHELLSELFDRPELSALLESSNPAAQRPESGQENRSEKATLPAGDPGNEQPQKDGNKLLMLKEKIESGMANESDWLNYGTCLEESRRFDDAAEAFLRAQEINPHNHSVYPAIVRCLESAGNKAMLQAFMTYCQELSPEIARTLPQDAPVAEPETNGLPEPTSRQPSKQPTPPAKLPTRKDRPTIMNRTFITGTDGSQEWMLKWWYRNITQHNPDIHITICDFGGMSEDVKEWAKLHANYFVQYPTHEKCAWFHKTQALLDSAYQYSCWVDIDCQVLKPIDDIFEYATFGKIGLTADPMRTRRDPAEHWWATGINVIKGISPLLNDWHAITKKAQVRGDQEALQELLKNQPERAAEIVELPLEYQWLRLQLANNQDNPRKKVIHWTGPNGKSYIKETLMEESDSDFTVPKQPIPENRSNETVRPKGYVVTLLDLPKSVASAERCVISGIKYGIPVEMCPAVDKSSARQEAAEEGLFISNFDTSFSSADAQIGNFVAQYRVWKEIIRSGNPGIVMEHDAIFIAPVPDLTGQGDIINLGHPSYGQYETQAIPGVYPLFSKAGGYMPGAHGYYLTVDGAKRLVNAAMKIGAGPADLFLCKKNLPEIRELYPWVIKADDSFSTIQKEKGCKAKHNFNKDYSILTEQINGLEKQRCRPVQGYIVTLMNMPESVEVAERCIRSAERYGIPTRMVPAVDKFVAEKEADKEGLFIAAFDTVTSDAGAVTGNFITQYRIWEEIIRSGEPGIVLEHDAVFTAPLPDLAGKGDIINLGYPSWGKFSTKEEAGVYPLFSIAQECMPGTHGYYVTVAGARQLVEAAKRLGACPTDRFLNRSNFPQIKEIYPWMIKAEDTFTTIQKANGCKMKHNYSKSYKIETDKLDYLRTDAVQECPSDVSSTNQALPAEYALNGLNGYVVTLLDLPDSVAAAERCISSARQFGISVKIFPAVNKYSARKEAGREGLVANNYDTRVSNVDAVIGNFVAQYRIWKEIVRSGKPGLVLEHDALFTLPVPDLTGQGDIINLGHPSWGKYNTKDEPGIYPLFSSPRNVMPGAHGYYLTVAGASRLVDLAQRTGTAPVDLFISLQNFPDIKEVYPWPIKAEDTFTTIQNGGGCRGKHCYDENYKVLT